MAAQGDGCEVLQTDRPRGQKGNDERVTVMTGPDLLVEALERRELLEICDGLLLQGVRMEDPGMLGT